MSVGSDGVDMRKIPGMLRKHGFPGSQTEEEGNRGMETHIATRRRGIRVTNNYLLNQHKIIKMPISSASNTDSPIKYIHRIQTRIN